MSSGLLRTAVKALKDFLFLRKKIPHTHYPYYSLGTVVLSLFREYVLCATTWHSSLYLPSVSPYL